MDRIQDYTDKELAGEMRKPSKSRDELDLLVAEATARLLDRDADKLAKPAKLQGLKKGDCGETHTEG